jgi:hypothetical protein
MRSRPWILRFLQRVNFGLAANNRLGWTFFIGGETKEIQGIHTVHAPFCLTLSTLRYKYVVAGGGGGGCEVGGSGN